MGTEAIMPETHLPQEMAVNTDALAQRAQNFQISTTEERQAACEMLEGVIELKQEILNHYEPMRQKAWDAYQEVLKRKKEKLSPVEQVEQMLRSKIGQFDQAERRRLLAEEEERRRKALEEERRKKAEEAERAREQGKEILAKAIEAAPVVPPPVVVAKEAKPAPTASGGTVSTREEWDFRIVDASLLPRDYLMPDEKTIRAVVKARKGNTQIPGVEVFTVADVTVRKARR